MVFFSTTVSDLFKGVSLTHLLSHTANSSKLKMVIFKKAGAFLVLFALCALMASETYAHFSLGRELRLQPARQGPVNPIRNLERRLYENKQRKSGKKTEMVMYIQSLRFTAVFTG